MLRQHAFSPELCPKRTQAALSLIDGRARRLARSWRLQPADREDARQTMILDVVARAQCFDPQRASWPAFVRVVSRHAACDFARTVISTEREELCDVDQFAGCDPCAGLHLKIDLLKTVSLLPCEAQRLVTMIADAHNITDAQKRSALPPATFYRALRDLRLRLIAAGLRPSAGRRSRCNALAA